MSIIRSSDFGFSGNNRINLSNYKAKCKLKYSSSSNKNTNIKANDIRDDVYKAMGLTIAEMAEIIDDILREALYQNDLVRSGKLLKSQEVNATSTSIDISYDVPYAGLIYYGGYIVPYGSPYGTRIYVPARPWIMEAINADFSGNFRRILSKYLSKVVTRI